ncbi:TolC family protein [Draconibacterium halophilum]|uniref:TolC family protein n=1 Tax=Draconibacterium halophilum TaxID=2706887 RepID=A0A6C0RAC7_9BACT|nr:TolC family protein [Draconibacterium halophilum]QIA06956.1 TolC family protein [Draconibacterium halophilum]
MNQSIKYIAGTVIVLLTVFGNTFGQKIMTLEECREQAVAFNKELKNAALQNREAQVNQEVARTAFLPSLGFSSSLMHRPNMDPISMPGYFLQTADSEEDALNGKFSGTSNVWKPGTTIDISSLTLINSGFEINQAIYAGGKIRYSNQQADAGVSIADMALNMKYSEVIEETDRAFWQVATVKENIIIATEYIKLLTELEEQMTAMYEVGLQPASEKLRVTVQKNEAELNLLKARNGLKVAKMYLNQILGQPLDNEIQISHEANPEVKLFNLEDGMIQASNKRNELKILEKQKEISELDAKITHADYLPTVGVSAQYTSYWVKDLNENIDFQPMLAAQVSIPIFQWGQGKKKQRAAQLKVQQAETDLQHTNDLINLEVMQVQVQVEEAYESIRLAKKNVAEAEESRDETQASFEVGLNTTTDILDAQAQWVKAKAQLIQAIASFEVLKTKWQSVTGNLYMPDEES